MSEKKPISIMILIFTMALFCSYHIYYYFIDKANDSLVRNYNTNSINRDSKNIVQNLSNKKEEYFAILEIPKINLVEGFYSIGSDKNDVNQSVTILKESRMPNQDGSIIYLAAHSGSGPLAFFKDLNKLSINDIVIIKYQNYEYHYSINDIYEMPKTGEIIVNHNIHDNYLVLTTCSNNKNMQLIITSKLIN